MNTPDLWSQLSQSGLLTLLGMGIVFGFLIVLIIFMKLTAWIVKALKLDKEQPKEKTTAKVSNTQEVVAAIATAVHDKQIKG